MKKYMALLLTLCLLAGGCGKKQEPEPAVTPAFTEQATEAPTQPETTEPPTTLPQTTPVRVMGDRVPVVRRLLSRGTSLEVTGYEEALAQVTANGDRGGVEARFLRFPDEELKPWTGYTAWNAGLYRDYTCLGEPLESYGTNVEVRVLEDLEGCYLVEIHDKTGFMKTSQLTKYPYQAPAEGGGDSGSSGSSGAQDGGDITLRVPGLRLLADTVKRGSATVKADGVPLVLRYCGLGDTVEVLETGGAPALPGYTPILEADGSVAYIPSDWLETAGSFTPWDGYAGNNCALFLDGELHQKAEKSIYTNQALKVLWDTGKVSLVQVENDRYFAASSSLRETPLVIAPAPDSGSSGGGGGSGSSDLWTPPVL